MASRPTSQITQLLRAAGQGDAAAADKLWSTVYERLHSVARALLAREPAACSLRPTSVIGAVWERIGLGDVDWADSGHFFAIARKVMRRILIEEARARNRHKRDGGRAPLPLVDELAALDQDHLKVLAVAEALEKLEQMNPLGARIVQLRYFDDLSIDETAAELGKSPRWVDNKWQTARVWLHHELSTGDSTWCVRGRRG